MEQARAGSRHFLLKLRGQSDVLVEALWIPERFFVNGAERAADEDLFDGHFDFFAVDRMRNVLHLQDAFWDMTSRSSSFRQRVSDTRSHGRKERMTTDCVLTRVLISLSSSSERVAPSTSLTNKTTRSSEPAKIF